MTRLTRITNPAPTLAQEPEFRIASHPPKVDPVGVAPSTRAEMVAPLTRAERVVPFTRADMLNADAPKLEVQDPQSAVALPASMSADRDGISFTLMPDKTAFHAAVDGTVTSNFFDGTTRIMSPTFDGRVAGPFGEFTSTSTTMMNGGHSGGQTVSNTYLTNTTGDLTGTAYIGTSASTQISVNADGSRESTATSTSGNIISVSRNLEGSITSRAYVREGTADGGVSTTTQIAASGESQIIARAGDGTTLTQSIGQDGNTSTLVVSPQGVQVSNQILGTVVNTVQENVVVTVNHDGTVGVVIADEGVLKVNIDGTYQESENRSLATQTSPDGKSSTISFNEGSTVTIYIDGSIAVNTSEGFTVNSGINGSAVVTSPDGICVTTTPSGQIVLAAGDGTTFVAAVDGYINVNTVQGNSLSVTPSGTITATDSDGCSLTNTSDGVIALAQSDGNTYLQSADGSFTISNQSGSTFTDYANGSSAVSIPGGTTFSVDPSGAVSGNAPGASYVSLPNGATAWNTSNVASLKMDQGASIALSGGVAYAVTADGVGISHTYSPDGSVTKFTFEDGSSIATTKNSAEFIGADGTSTNVPVENWKNFEGATNLVAELKSSDCANFEFNMSPDGVFLIPDGNSGSIELGLNAQLTWKSFDGAIVTAGSELQYSDPAGVVFSLDPSGPSSFNNGAGLINNFDLSGASSMQFMEKCTLTVTPGGTTVISAGEGDASFTIGVNGTVTAAAPDGTTIVASSDGTTVVNDYASNTVTTLVDGSTLINCDSGIAVVTSSVGTTAIATQDGATLVISPDGTTSVGTGDGVSIVNTGDGTTLTMMQGDVYVTNDQGTVLYDEGVSVSLPNGDTLSLSETGAIVQASGTSSVEISRDATLQISINDQEAIRVSDAGGFAWSNEEGSTVAINPETFSLEASFTFGIDIAMTSEGYVNVAMIDGSQISMFEDGSTLVVMSDATSVVVPDGGGISISSSDGTDVEVSNDASITVTSLLGDETESSAGASSIDSAPVQIEADALLVEETSSLLSPEEQIDIPSQAPVETVMSTFQVSFASAEDSSGSDSEILLEAVAEQENPENSIEPTSDPE